MAIAVQSVSTTAMGGGATITKPAGLTVGDLLLAIVADDGFGSAFLTEPAGWTALFRSSSGAGDYAEVLVCYIEATSTETAASDFTFTNAAGGILYRISGGVPSLISSDTGAVIGSQSLVIAIGLTGDNDSDSTSFDSYGVTGGASVSFTERYDSSTSSGTRVSLGVADGVYNSGDDITAFSATPTSGGLDDVAKFLVKIPASQSATASNALFQTTPVVFATLTGSTQEPENDFMDIVPEIFEQSATATNPTVWQNEDKPSTTWINDPL